MMRAGRFTARRRAGIAPMLLGAALPAIAQTTRCPAPMASEPQLLIDAVHGDDHGDGSAAHPWRTLKHALAWPGLAQGATLRLNDGDYGALAVYNQHNRHFVTIEAAPGQHPRLSSIRLAGSDRWLLRGLTIGEDLTRLPGDMHGFLVVLSGPHHDIIFADNRLGIASQPGWSRANWLTHVPSGLLDSGGNVSGCTLISGNRFQNVSFGIGSQRSPGTTIMGNVIDRFIHDGIDFGSSDMVIRGNTLTNRIDAGDWRKLHPDFMQGQPWASMTPQADRLRHITIERNLMILRTDPRLPFADQPDPDFVVQGISVFDGDWTGLRVVDNVIVTRAYHGIALYGAHHSAIRNNTMLSDGSDRVHVPWIGAFVAKPVYGGAPSSDIVIANNITGGLRVDPANRHVRVEHNLLLTAGGNGAAASAWAAHNVISARPLAQVFIRYEPSVLAFDLRLSPKGKAITGQRDVGAHAAERSGG